MSAEVGFGRYRGTDGKLYEVRWNKENTATYVVRFDGNQRHTYFGKSKSFPKWTYVPGGKGLLKGATKLRYSAATGRWENDGVVE